MKTLFALIFMIFPSCLPAQLSYYDPILDELEEFSPKDLDEMLAEEPERALLRLEGLISDYEIKGNKPEQKRYRRALARVLLKHSQLEDYATKLISETPRHYESLEATKILTGLILYLRSPWTVRLLTNELMDDTPVTQPGYSEEEIYQKLIHQEWRQYNPQTRAVNALVYLDLPHAPANEHTFNRSKEYLTEWKTWWTTYGDEIMATLEAEEAEYQAIEEAAIAAKQAKAERYENRHLNPQSPPRPAVEQGKKNPQSSRWPFMIALAVFVTSLAAYLITRLRNRRAVNE